MLAGKLLLHTFRTRTLIESSHNILIFLFSTPTTFSAITDFIVDSERAVAIITLKEKTLIPKYKRQFLDLETYLVSLSLEFPPFSTEIYIQIKTGSYLIRNTAK